MSELTRSNPEKYIPCPLSVCVAMSQGYIGYDLQNALREEMLDRGINTGCTTILTQVEVDANDPAFENPTKPIGAFMTKEEADKLVKEKGYKYPEGRWFTENAWGRVRMRKNIRQDSLLIDYLEPTWRWIDVLQNDFAARADWCVKPYEEANHAPIVRLKNKFDIFATAGDEIELSAEGTKDPDGDELVYRWWFYKDAGTYDGEVCIKNHDKLKSLVTVPENVRSGDVIHIICEVTDSGEPKLTRYQRTVIRIK